MRLFFSLAGSLKSNPRDQTSDLEVSERGNRARFKFVVGDYFTMTPDTAGTFDAAFDRGAYRGTSLIRRRPPPVGPPYGPRHMLL